jgi:hypothetical protein
MIAHIGNLEAQSDGQEVPLIVSEAGGEMCPNVTYLGDACAI